MIGASRPPSSRIESQRGFTLIETLAALALSGLIVAMLLMLTGQWFPTWNGGFVRLQAVDLAATALDRIVVDISGAEYVTADKKELAPFFDGSANAVTFVRRSLGPASSPGLEVVRLTEANDRRGVGLLRARAPFTPALADVAPGGNLAFPESVFVMRGDYRFSFSYLGRDGAWRDRWSDAKHLPVAVRIGLRDSASGQLLAISTSARLHITISPLCIRGEGSPAQCD